jgi:RNA polymerase sigma-70 factor (ECF subfamily)
MISEGRGAKTSYKRARDLGTHTVDGRPSVRKQQTPRRAVRPVPLEDAELIEKVRNGNAEAFGQLVRKYQDRVFNTCWRICGHLEDARDLTQDAFLKAYEQLPGFRQQSGFYTWIFRVAVNLALSHRRDAKRRRTVSLDDAQSMAGTQAEGLAKRIGRASANDPAQAVSRAELQGYVTRALQALDDDHRAVVVLRDIEGFDYQEISEILGIPSGTVKSRLHRARRAICESVRPALARDG